MNIACSCYEALSYILLIENIATVETFAPTKLPTSQRTEQIYRDLEGLEQEGESSRVRGRISLWRLNNEHQAWTCSQGRGWAGGNRLTQFRNEKLCLSVLLWMKLLALAPELRSSGRVCFHQSVQTEYFIANTVSVLHTRV